MANTNNRNQADGRFDKTPHLVLKDVKISMRNFRGLDRNGFNPQHKRTFWVLLDPERFDIEAMRNDGWNIKEIQKREGHEDDPTMFRLEVEVRFDNFPPVIHQVTKLENGKYKRTLMTEKSSEVFDSSDIVNCNLEIGHGRTWYMSGKYGIKAYLKKAQIEVAVDEWDSYYDWDEDDECPFE